jgi:hypothetical protein
MFPDAQSHSTQSQDYYNWGWKEIEAAVNGGSELVGTGAQAKAAVYSNPNTLLNAADVFETVRQLLGVIADTLENQSKALASGPDAPWQGDAANAFYSSVSMFAAQVRANFNVLDAGTSGLLNVPDQLNQAGNELTYRQAVVNEIDTFYANMASNLGAGTVNGGLVQVSQFPAIANAMKEDMLYFGLLPLATVYQRATASIHPAVPPTLTTGNPNGQNQPNINMPYINMPYINMPYINMPPLAC